MKDEDSSSTSYDDKSEFNENPTRDALADGLMSFLKPRVDNLYKLVNTVRYVLIICKITNIKIYIRLFY